MKHSIYVDVGQKVRERRWVVGMTLQQLGDRVGITAQQIRKFEAATNRFSARGMRDIAAALEVPVAYFFEGIDGQAPDTGMVRGDPLTDQEALNLVRTYHAIPKNQRRHLFDLAYALAEPT